MQFAWLSVQAQTSVIVDTIGHITALLHLGDQGTATDRMHATRRDKEDIPALDRILLQHLADGVILHPLPILILGDAGFEAAIELRLRECVHDIPHLRLAEATVTFHRQLVVRMHLHGEVMRGIDELHQQREGDSVHGIDHLTQQQFPVRTDQLVQFHPLQRTIRHDRLAVADRTDLPTLPYFIIFGRR